MKYYLAYGSNLNKAQMARRCPSAVAVGTTTIEGYGLVFRRRYLTIEPMEGESVSVGIWRISDEDEESLDRYEGFPKFYHKEIFNVRRVGAFTGEVPCMVYIMNDGFPIEFSTSEYRKTVAQGYRDFGFDLGPLIDADLAAYEVEHSTTNYTTKR